jgi:hypothetical protein
MKPIYEENEETLEIAEQISCHIPPTSSQINGTCIRDRRYTGNRSRN